MQGYSNDDTISIHITDSCSIRCNGCYLGIKRKNEVIPFDYVKMAMDKLEPKNVVFFGGEAILKPDYLHTIMDVYPNVNYVLHTNGVTYDSSIFDRIATIALTLDTIDFSYFKKNKTVSFRQYENLMKTLGSYASKIVVTHNIYPHGNEPHFYENLVSLNSNYSSIPIDWYLMVTPEKDQEYLPEFDNYHPCRILNVQPKLRILLDGTVTRDMTGHYNICHIKDWKRRYKLKEVPVSSKCISCNFFMKCHACNMFPHFCKTVLDSIDYKPHFCKFTEMFYARKENYYVNV